MPAWLDDLKWHNVRIVVSEDSAVISVSQGLHPYTTVLQVSLSGTPEPLGVEFSIDNEVYPGLLGPVYVPDGLNIGYFDIRLSH